MSTTEGLLWAPAAVPVRVEEPADVGAAVAAIRVRDRRYRRSLALADVTAGWVAVITAALVYGSMALAWAMVFTPVALICAGKLLGLYDRDEVILRKTTLEEAPKLFQLAMLILVGLWLTGITPADRAEFVVLGSLLLCLLAGLRALSRRAVGRFVAEERCVFVGDGREYRRLAGKLASNATHARLVSCVSPGSLDAYGDTPPGAGAVSLVSLLAHSGAQRVIVEPSALPEAEMLDLVRALKGLGLRVSLLPKVLDVVGTAVEFDELDGMTLLGVRSFGMSRSSWVAKRTFDLVVATAAFIVAAPVMAVVALAIMLDSGGPVLFRQVRIGRNGKPFQILKFRTMVADAEQRKDELRKLYQVPEHGLFKLEADPRMTRVGRLLRSSCLDELPQIINVLRGEMSIVGPRPLVVDEDAQVRGWDRRRLHLTPGMTGRWQIAGSGRVPLPEMVKIDYLYAARWTLWSDLKILLRTIPFMLTRRNL
ncbi:MAG: exopolysaccharide biosynthesis polyprenyl glycosylphosphotransferase [Solirubrobacteraceae bacterium]